MQYDIGLLVNKILYHLNTHSKSRIQEEVILAIDEIWDSMKNTINPNIPREDIVTSLSTLELESLIEEEKKDHYKITKKGKLTIKADRNIFLDSKDKSDTYII